MPLLSRGTAGNSYSVPTGVDPLGVVWGVLVNRQGSSDENEGHSVCWQNLPNGQFWQMWKRCYLSYLRSAAHGLVFSSSSIELEGKAFKLSKMGQNCREALTIPY